MWGVSPGKTGWGEGVGGTTDRGLWGKGRLATVVNRVFLRVGGTKWEPQGTGGGRQLVPKAEAEPEDLGVPSAGLCLRGAVRAGGAAVPEAWRVEGCVASVPQEGHYHSRVTPALCEESSSDFASSIFAVGVIRGARGMVPL